LERVEDFAGDVALKAAHHLRLGLPFGETPRHVVAGGLVAAQPHDQDDLWGPVGVAVAIAVESMPDGFASRRRFPGSARTWRYAM
jgi:hypothetical protein